MIIALPLDGDVVTQKCYVTGMREPLGWERFDLKEVQPTHAELGNRLDRVTELYHAASTGGLRTSIERNEGAAVIEIISRLAPDRDFETLAIAVLNDPAAQQGVFEAAAKDPYSIGLHNLVENAKHKPGGPRRSWFGRRREAAPAGRVDLVNDTRFSGLADHLEDGTYASFAQKLNAIARRRRPPNRRLCALATMRDEGAYILEWVAYHRILGVEHFFIYSNDNTDGSNHLLAALAKNGVITWIENEDATGNKQAKAYGHCLSIVPDVLDYEWCVVLDADEIVSLREGGFATLSDYLAWQESRPVDVVVLPWCVFLSNGETLWSDDLSIKRFCHQNHRSGLGKSIFRPSKFTFAHPHHPASNDRTMPVIVRDSAGVQVSYPRGRMTGYELPNPEYGQAWVNHYFTRSAEEFLWKWSRGRADFVGPGTGISFSDVNEDFVANLVKYHHSIDMAVPDGVYHRVDGVNKTIADLLAMPGVKAAQDEVILCRRAWAAKTPELIANLQTLALSDGKKDFLALFAK